MSVVANERPKGERREVAPLEPIDANDGPAMLALPTERHRMFVRALYQVKPGHGANVKAARARRVWLSDVDPSIHGDDRKPPRP